MREGAEGAERAEGAEGADAEGEEGVRLEGCELSISRGGASPIRRPCALLVTKGLWGVTVPSFFNNDLLQASNY